MHWNDCPRAFGYAPLGILKTNVKAAGNTVTQDWMRAEVGDYFRGRGERIGWNQNFVARSQADGIQRQLKGGRPGVDCQSVLGANIAGEFFLEFERNWPGRQPTGR